MRGLGISLGDTGSWETDKLQSGVAKGGGRSGWVGRKKLDGHTESYHQESEPHHTEESEGSGEPLNDIRQESY